jgi:uncharacterized membrane protein
MYKIGFGRETLRNYYVRVASLFAGAAGRLGRRKLLLSLVLVNTFLYSALSISQHRHFLSGYDVAIFNQAVWLYSRFSPPRVSVRSNRAENLLGDHFHPIVATLAPLYWLNAGAETLFVAQGLLVALSVVPVFLFAEGRLGRRPAWLFAISYSLYWGVQRTVEFEFHEVAFAIPLIASAILFIERRMRKGYFVCFVLLLLTKENLSLLVAFFGVYLLLLRRLKDGLITLALGAATLPLLIKVVIPALSRRTYSYWAYSAFGTGPASALQTILRKPAFVLEILSTPPVKLQTMWLIFSSLLFLPLLSPLLVLTIPLLAERFLGSNLNFWQPYYHYNGTITPIVVMAAADAISRVARLFGEGRARRACVYVLTAGVMAMTLYMQPTLPLWRLTSPDVWRLTDRERVGREALSVIPPEASVAAQINIAPHLSARRDVYILHPYAVAPDCDYVIASSQVPHHPFESFGEIEEYLRRQEARGYVRAFERDGWVVLRQAEPAAPDSPPVLITQEDSTRAAALESVSFTSGPFTVRAIHSFSPDGRTRIVLFGLNVDMRFKNGLPAAEVWAEDLKGRSYRLEVETVDRVLKPFEVTQVVARLPEEMEGAGEVWVSIKSRGVASNRALITIAPSARR